MDLVLDRDAKEDRISNLPDDIIRHILSFLDMKYVIQFCTLSRKWKDIWISMPQINLSRHMFHSQPAFAKFLKHALSHRNNSTEVSDVELTFTGAVTQFAVKSILKYAYSHNVRQLTMRWFTRKSQVFTQDLFSSSTLKHLTLATNDKRSFYYSPSCIPTSAWDFPALETMHLSNMRIGEIQDKSLDLFSRCVNLKDLTLDKVSIYEDMEIFHVCAPKLSNFTITRAFSFPKVFNLIAPRLENLTAPVRSQITRRELRFLDSLHLSTKGFSFLEKVNLSLDWPTYNYPMQDVHVLLNLFQKLRSAKYLILDVPIIQALKSCVCQPSVEPCPFDNLKCLKINTVPLKQKEPIPTIHPQVKNYLLENSPSATFIMDLPQVPQKRSREEIHNDAMSKKVAKLETKLQKKDEVIAEQKAMLETVKLQHAKLMSGIFMVEMAQLRKQIEGGNPDYEVIRSIGCVIKSLMDLIPKSSRQTVELQFSSQYEEMKSLCLTRVDASNWAKIESELLSYVRNSKRNHFININAQLNVPAAE